MEAKIDVQNKFWLNKTLDEMNQEEWESLCDGCGKCCLEKLEDEDGIVHTTRVSCRLLNTETCKCSFYNDRFKYIDDCIKLTPAMVKTIKWLPKTCAYRLVNEKKDLFPWHPLYNPEVKKRGKNSTVLSGNSAAAFAIHPILMQSSLADYIMKDETIYKKDEDA